MQKVIKKFKDKNATIGIIGLGYVGLPLAIRFSEAGFKTFGFDFDKDKVKKLNSGISYIGHIESKKISSLVGSNYLSAFSSYENISNCDAVIICLPTPLDKNLTPDLSYIISSVDSFKNYVKKETLISLESTTYPGTTEEEILSRFEDLGFHAGKDIFIVYSPEREDPGNKDFNTKNTPKVCGGFSENCSILGKAMYEQIIDEVISVSSLRVAEMTKLLENIQRSVNIGLMNEMKRVSDKMDIDIYEVIDAASTKPFGFTPYYPGPGLGGHCIPIDPFYLSWKAKEYGESSRFIELAGEVNRSMPNYVIQKISSALNLQNKSIKNSNILIIGVAYKKNIDDARESPSIEIIGMLNKLGANVDYHDNFLPKLPAMRKSSLNMSSKNLTKKYLENIDIVVIATDHDYINYSKLLDHSQLILDCRGRYRNLQNKKILKS